MKNKSRPWTGVFASIGLLIMIIDSKTALTGAREGVELCLHTVIPSLFPFFVLSTLINRSITGKSIALIQPVSKACGVPLGAESLFLLGFLGGYPVGAQAINEAFANKQLDKEDARRMLGFCSNAGPAFIFGMVSSLFENPFFSWVVWLIQILSAVLVGIILPKKRHQACSISSAAPFSFQSAVELSAKTMLRVCSWVIVFRVLNTFFVRWFLWIFPTEIQVAITGIIELTNGCYALNAIEHVSTRFVLCTGMLSFGGICVVMQTGSVTKEIGAGMYFPGKLLQACISILLSCAALPLLFPGSNTQCVSTVGSVLSAVVCAIMCLILNSRKKVVEITC